MGPSEETLVGKIVRITFHHPDTHFTVAKIRPSGKACEVSAVGIMPFVQGGLDVSIQGAWKVDPKHGRQFIVEKYKYELPSDKEGVIQFLSSGILPGIGKALATKMWNHFGKAILHVLDVESERLDKLPGFSSKKIQSIRSSWQEHTQFQELSYLFMTWGITHRQATKILQKWGHESVDVIHQNPYILAQEIQGIGFQLADTIARSIGFDLHSQKRLMAAIEFFLWEKSNEGHTAPPLEEFINYSAELLGVSKEAIQECVKKVIQSGRIALIKSIESSSPQLQLAHYAFLEQSIAHDIVRLSSTPSLLRKFDIEKALTWAEEKVGLVLHSTQKEACRTSLSNQVSIITGGPGTGKSTIIRILLAIYQKLTSKIILTAPTGKAAKRLFEVTNAPSKTIHRLLHFSPAKGCFEHTTENPIPADVVIIDEASMLDSQLASSLFKAIPSGAHVVIVGDVNQLPSIGAGAVLSDLIDSKKIATTTLTEIFRQAQRSAIIQSAHRILNGNMPFLKNHPASDFLFFAASEPEEAQKSILTLLFETIPERFGFDSKQDIQILSPMKKGALGCDALNTLLQSRFSGCSVQEGHKALQIGDKVMQIKNNYLKDVYNGDIGWVVEVDSDLGMVTVSFDDRLIEYTLLEQEELILAWAVSVHKYQGSEVPCVIIPVHTQHFKLLTKNLLYTAVTRGKKLVVLVGTIKAIAIAVHQKESILRWTGLQRCLIEPSVS